MSPKKSPPIMVKTRTATKVKTQIAVATVVLLAAGFAAYGFGFLPMLKKGQNPNPSSSGLPGALVQAPAPTPAPPVVSGCTDADRASCDAAARQCIANGNDPSGCYQESDRCKKKCEARSGTAGSPAATRAFKTKPIVRQLPLISHTLATGIDLDLFRFQVSANAAGPLGFKKLVLSMAAEFGSSSTTVSHLRLRRGTVDMPLSDYKILGSRDYDLRNGNWTPATGGDGSIAIIFREAETISDAGNVYTLHAVIGGPVSAGDRLKVNGLTPGQPPLNVIGYLTEAGSASIRAGVMGPNIDMDVMADGVPDASPLFVWSDLSESSHLDLPGTHGGSRDWIAGDVSGSLGIEMFTR